VTDDIHKISGALTRSVSGTLIENRSKLVIRGLRDLAQISNEHTDNAPPTVILISRESVEANDTSRVVDILGLLREKWLVARRNTVRIVVNGYDDDPRDLFDIDEVRSYFQKLFIQVPGLFYWIEIDSYMFSFLGLMLYRPFRPVTGKVGITPADLQRYLARGFEGLNYFCGENKVSPQPTTWLVTRWLKRNEPSSRDEQSEVFGRASAESLDESVKREEQPVERLGYSEDIAYDELRPRLELALDRAHTEGASIADDLRGLIRVLRTEFRFTLNEIREMKPHVIRFIKEVSNERKRNTSGLNHPDHSEEKVGQLLEKFGRHFDAVEDMADSDMPWRAARANDPMYQSTTVEERKANQLAAFEAYLAEGEEGLRKHLNKMRAQKGK
jgi:hypothetical protein